MMEPRFRRARPSQLSAVPTPRRMAIFRGPPPVCPAATAPDAQALVDGLNAKSEDAASLVSLRKALSTRLTIQAVIDAGGLPLLVSCLESASISLVQLEAACCLALLTAGKPQQTLAVADAGAAEALLAILQLGPALDEHAELCEQCLLALGNLVGDTSGDESTIVVRDRLLRIGVLDAVARFYALMPELEWDVRERAQVLRPLTWLLANLCRGHPAPPLDAVDCLFDYFCQAVVASEDTRILCEAIEGLACLLEGALQGATADDRLPPADNQDLELERRARRFLEIGYGHGQLPQPPKEHAVLKKLVQCFAGVAGDGQRHLVLAPSLRLLGLLLVMPDSDLTALVLEAGALKSLCKALLREEVPVCLQIEAAKVLANTAFSSGLRALRLAEDPALFGTVCLAAERAKEARLQHQCASIIAGVARHGQATLSHIDCVAALRILADTLKEPISGLSKSRVRSLQRRQLDAIQEILLLGDEQIAEANTVVVHPYISNKAGVAEALESLQDCMDDDEIHTRVQVILVRWFGATPEADREAAASASDQRAVVTPAKTPERPSPSSACSLCSSAGRTNTAGLHLTPITLLYGKPGGA